MDSCCDKGGRTAHSCQVAGMGCEAKRGTYTKRKGLDERFLEENKPIVAQKPNSSPSCGRCIVFSQSSPNSGECEVFSLDLDELAVTTTLFMTEIEEIFEGKGLRSVPYGKELAIAISLEANELLECFL